VSYPQHILKAGDEESDQKEEANVRTARSVIHWDVDRCLLQQPTLSKQALFDLRLVHGGEE